MISKPSVRATIAVLGAMLVGGGAGFGLGHAKHSPAVPSLKTISSAISAASHGELAPVRILPVPHGVNLPSNVIPIQVNITLPPAGGNKPALIWAVYHNGKLVFFPGSAFDTKGVNLAIPLMRLMQSAAVPASATGASAVIRAPGFIWAAPGQRAARPDVVLFVDPNCIFCHLEFTQLKPLVDAGEVVVKVVPVAFLKASSMGKAEAILNGGLSAFLENESAFNNSTEEGAISPMNVPNLAQEVQSNTQLLSELEGGRVATPFMLVRQNAGGHEEGWQPHMGLITGSELSAMLGKG